MDRRPIGVFDSGLGGLTVVKELKTLLPRENIVYFGDTGRVPYGTRSFKTIEKYAAQDIAFLIKLDVKFIIAACGTVSSVASHIGHQCGVPYMDVVMPAALAAANATENGRVGVIGTTATIHSHSFDQALSGISPDIQTFGRDCPILVSLVENNWFSKHDDVAYLSVKRYLDPLLAENIDTLILGCTHFPLLWDVIRRVVGDRIVLINSGLEAAQKASEALTAAKLLNQAEPTPYHRFYISDTPDGFVQTASIFLGQNIHDEVFRVDVDHSFEIQD